MNIPIPRLRAAIAIAAAAAFATTAAAQPAVSRAEADHPGRAVHARWRQRHPRPRHRAAHGPAARPDHRHRQQAGRRRQHRHRLRRARAAGRLHARHRLEPGDDEPLPRHEGAVQDRQGLRADRPDRVGADGAGGEHRAAVQDPAGVHRLRQGQSRQGQLQQPRQRHAAAHGRRGVRQDEQGGAWCTCPTAAPARRSAT